MALNNSSILIAPTLAATAGTVITMINDGKTVRNGIHLIDAGSTDYRTMKQITAKATPPPLQGGMYGMAKNTVSILSPSIDSLGRIQFNKLYFERSVHSEFSAADRVILNALGAQTLFDADWSTFWTTGGIL